MRGQGKLESISEFVGIQYRLPLIVAVSGDTNSEPQAYRMAYLHIDLNQVKRKSGGRRLISSRTTTIHLRTPPRTPRQ